MELIIRMSGQVVESNFDDWKTGLLAEIDAANRELVTDDDFAWADLTVKQFKDAEKAIKQAKDDALAQTADIAAMFSAVDEIAGQLAKTRLALEKQVKIEKERRKAQLIDEAKDEILRQIMAGTPFKTHFTSNDIDIDRVLLTQAIAGKKTLEGAKKALDAVSLSIVAERLDSIKSANANMETILAAELDHPGLFHDKRNLAWKTEGEVVAIIDARVAQARLQMKEKEEREKIAAAKEVFSAPPADPPVAPPAEPPPAHTEVEPPPQPSPGSPVEAGQFIFTVNLSCDVETAKRFAKEIAATFRGKKEIVSFNLKRA